MTRIYAGVVVALVVAGLLGLATADTNVKSHRRAHRSITEGMACSNCHTPAGWHIAGVSSGSGFDHAKTGFPLSGRHKSVACTQCHQADRNTQRACVSCHTDTHQGRLGRQCDSCHSANSWQDTNAVALHRDTRLPLTGMHVLADCTQCHRRTAERQWSAAPSQCFACHVGEYFSQDTHPRHRGTGTQAPFPRDCSQCHQAMAWSPAYIDPTTITQNVMASTGLISKRQHNRVFTISSGPHRRARCGDCHVSQTVPKLVECVGCHAHNPVKIRKQHREPVSRAATACLACHPGGARR